MKKYLFIAATAFVLCALFVPLALAGEKTIPPAPTAFEQSPGWKKLDLRTRMAWQENTKNSDEKPVDCLLKTTHRLEPTDIARLEAEGFTIRTNIGSILTGETTTKDLPIIANLDFVEVIELSVPMSMKKHKKNK